VNEASCPGCPVIASDLVGAAQELIALLNPPFIFPYGDVDALAELLEVVLANPVLLAERGRAAGQRMETCQFKKISPGPQKQSAVSSRD
jgi:glycosyltransferase involved in cell wall biosynthesis